MRPAASLLAACLLAPTAVAADGPGLFAEVSRALVAAAVGDTHERPEQVNDMILGAHVTGSGRSRHDVGVEFAPCDRQAVLDLTLAGTARTRTVGVSGPVHVHTNGFTRFAGRKRVSTDGERIEIGPAVVRVRQDTELTGVGTRFAGPLDRVVSGVAARTFYREQDEANHESAQITERSISQEFDRDASLQVADAERAYRRVQAELRRRGLWPQDFRLSTTADELRVRGKLSELSPPRDSRGAQ